MNKRITLVFVAVSICGSLLALSSGIARAQAYPEKPVRLVLGFPPGGGSDTLARFMAPRLTATLGQPLVVDTRAGAAGNIASEFVVRAPPDGYTLFMGFATTLTVNPLLYKLSYDVQRDLAPIIHLGTTQYFLVLHPSVPAKSVKEFIALARQNPGKLNYASSGSGAPLHLAAELFKQRTGINLVHVPYKGGGPAGAAVLAGETQVLFGSVASTLSNVKAGKLRALAVTSNQRSPLMPELPTIEESGVPNYNVAAWDSILAPAGTPRPIINKVNAEFAQLLKQSDVREFFIKSGYEPTGSTPEELAARIKAETAMWAKVIEAARIRVE